MCYLAARQQLPDCAGRQFPPLTLVPSACPPSAPCSFADYYDPKRMNFGALRVVNDDLVRAKAGFGCVLPCPARPARPARPALADTVWSECPRREHHPLSVLLTVSAAPPCPCSCCSLQGAPPPGCRDLQLHCQRGAGAQGGCGTALPCPVLCCAGRGPCPGLPCLALASPSTAH